MTIWNPQGTIETDGDGLPWEWGRCAKHQMPARRFADGSWACWWESICETDGHHEPEHFQPTCIRVHG